MSFVLKFIGQGWPKSGYSSNWLNTALFEYHITIMSKLSGAKLSICQELITNYLSMLCDSTEIQKRSFWHLHYSFLFIVVPSSWWSNWINAQIFNLRHAQILTWWIPHGGYTAQEKESLLKYAFSAFGLHGSKNSAQPRTLEAMDSC